MSDKAKIRCMGDAMVALGLEIRKRQQAAITAEAKSVLAQLDDLQIALFDEAIENMENMDD